MNKYAARGIMLDAIEGKRILVLTVGVHEITHVLGELEAQFGEVPCHARVQRRGGGSGIDIEGAGRVAVMSWRQSHRSTTFDTVYLDSGVDAEIRSLDKLAELRGALSTSPAGEIIRA